ncbi:MAG: hypothetical protein DWQ44_12070 [Bacteroidetes bacterium]|mgnify:CR=1 FL=1|nr:MAG: hypothetical protein DWQ33_07940 [Bacteroidota bacterium]REK08017.1 MAG: hypothetical protein DWQ39_00215 [Bacteroidota bacterium]REK32222.1 MAG: hypothetical protein DWQ44_12070 [Bacteroidota bacterium]REK47374.1 MAG: hypothetical protein DWQ48_12640 [Bacteroidota bacterium]
MKTSNFILILFLACYRLTFGVVPASLTGKGQVSIVSDELWSRAFNPSICPGHLRIAAGISSEGHFLADDYGKYRFIAMTRKGKSAAGMHIYRAGTGRFHFGGMEFSYSNKLAEKFYAGISMVNERWNYGAESSERHSAWYGKAGLYSKPLDKLSVAFLISNPGGQKWNNAMRLPIDKIIICALSYESSDNVHLYFQTNKYYGKEFSFHGGIEYRYQNQFTLRSGISSLPFTGSFGASLSWKKIVLDIGSEFHGNTGHRTMLSIAFQI